MLSMHQSSSPTSLISLPPLFTLSSLFYTNQTAPREEDQQNPKTHSNTGNQIMGKKIRSAFTSRAWNLLRLALFWARKGGIFTPTAMLDFLKSLCPAPRNSINYGRGERQFSFHETPMFRFKMHRPASMRFCRLPHIPCINPSVVDFDDEGREGEIDSCYLRSRNDDEEFDYESSDGVEYHELRSGKYDHLDGEDEGIDSKAEEFIARFYEQMRLQRQVSHLEYTEMLQRSVS